MGNYIEEYKIPGQPDLGIEDFQAPGKHFFPDRAPKRFICWSGGGGIGRYDTLEEAREALLRYVTEQLDETVSKNAEKMRIATEALVTLCRPDRGINAFKQKSR